MSLTAAALKLMAEKGLSAFDIAAIAEAMEDPKPDTAAERRRAWDRERKREQREAERLSGGMSGGNPPNPSPNEIDILTPTRESKTETKVSSKGRDEKLQALGSCLRMAFPTPEGVSDEQWSAFRGQRKKKLNARSYALLCSKLAKLAEDGWPPGELIDLAIERGWETVFAPRNFADDRRTNSMGRHQPADGLSSTARAGLAVFGAASARNQH